MPLDPAVAALLAQINTLGVSEPQTLAQLREAGERMRAWQEAPPTVGAVADAVVPTEAGGVPVRIYSPFGSAEPRPLLVFFHGGGWVRGSTALYDTPCRRLANETGCVVVSADYRLAPETKFPGAVEDAWAVAQWAAQHGAAWGGNPSRLVVAGDSAGGTLAAVVARRARDAGGPPIGCQLLFYPVTDYRFETPSYHEFAEGYLLTRAGMQAYWEFYLRDPADGDSPDASPLRAADLSGLPPACVLTNEYDVLRDEGEHYAARLRGAGVTVRLVRLPGMIHPGLHLTGVTPLAGRLFAEAARAVRAASGVSQDSQG